MKEASFYKKKDGKVVECLLCRHHCIVTDGSAGICGVRENSGGVLYARTYGLPCASHVDPIEKKPLFHFYPGSRAFSIATLGCNFQCLHCQNHDISQAPREEARIFGEEMTPDEVVASAARDHCTSISYTYTEPTVFFEYAYDIARLAKERGIENNFVTNGYIEEAPLRLIRPYLDAANIDLKGFTESFYRKVCKADLPKVLDTIKLYRDLGIWIELTTLIIPGHNDSEDELKAMAGFIAGEVGVGTPWHVSAFYPTYKLLDVERTGREALERARQIGLDEGLRYVYEGNLPGSDGENTYCYNCGKVVIGRHGYTVTDYNLNGGVCRFCGSIIDGVGL